jgi:hypothetical protein
MKKLADDRKPLSGAKRGEVRFYLLIDAEEYLFSVVRYIHHNPVLAGMIADVDRYRCR